MNMFFRIILILLINYCLQTHATNQVSLICLNCICQASSGCNTTVECFDDVCGPFYITKMYWKDANQPTAFKEPPNSPRAFEDCATDFTCAIKTVNGYLQRHAKVDCNDDGRIDCDDYAAVHYWGADECSNVLPSDYSLRYLSCMRMPIPQKQ